MRYLIRIVLILSVAVPGALFAKELVVPDQYPTVEEAMGVLEDGDTILLLPGEYDGGFTAPEGVGFSMIGRGGRDSTLIRGIDPPCDLLVVYGGDSAIHLRGIHFDHGVTGDAADPWAVWISGGNVIVEECRMTGCNGMKLEHCSGSVHGNQFQDCFDALRLKDSPMIVSDNLFTGTFEYAILCRASTAEIVRNRFVESYNPCIIVIGKKKFPVIGGSPGNGNMFIANQNILVINQSRNDINAQYNYWGVLATSTMNETGYPANIGQIQDFWDFEDRGYGKVDFSNWVQSEDEALSPSAGRKQLPILVVILVVLGALLGLFFRRKKAITE